MPEVPPQESLLEGLVLGRPLNSGAQPKRGRGQVVLDPGAASAFGGCGCM